MRRNGSVYQLDCSRRERHSMDKIQLPPDIEFHEDRRLLVWRPCGCVNKTGVSKIITILGEPETRLKQPFGRFADTVQADAVDLNFELSFAFPVSASRLRQSPADKISDPCYRSYSCSLRQGTRIINSRFAIKAPVFW